jgi:hypothetical protein
VPTPLDAAPATLLAVSAWLRGDGAMARIALDRALDSQPDYALAGLLSRGLDSGLNPRDLRGMVAATQAEPGWSPGLPDGPDDLVDGLLDGLVRDQFGDLLGLAGADRPASGAAQLRAAPAAATARRARARRGRRTPSRTKRPRSQE